MTNPQDCKKSGDCIYQEYYTKQLDSLRARVSVLTNKYADEKSYRLQAEIKLKEVGV